MVEGQVHGSERTQRASDGKEFALSKICDNVARNMSSAAPTLLIISTKSQSILYPPSSTQKFSATLLKQYASGALPLSQPVQNLHSEQSVALENTSFPNNIEKIGLTGDETVSIHTPSLLSLLLTLNILNHASFMMQVELLRERNVQSGGIHGNEALERHFSNFADVRWQTEGAREGLCPTRYTILSHCANDLLYVFITTQPLPLHRILLRQIMSYHQVDLAQRHLPLSSLHCKNVAKYFLLDCFTVTKGGENDRIISVQKQQDDKFSSTSNSMSALDAFHMQTVCYMFDYLGEYTMRLRVRSNHVLHPSSEHFPLLLACCRYCVQHKDIRRSVVRLMHNVFVGLIWLPLYSTQSRGDLPNTFMFVLLEEKQANFDTLPFEDVLVSTSHLCDMNGSTIRHISSAPLLHVSWCTDARAFTEEQHEQINTYIAELTPKRMPQPPKQRAQPPKRRFVVAQNPLSHLQTGDESAHFTRSVSPSILVGSLTTSPKSSAAEGSPPIVPRPPAPQESTAGVEEDSSPPQEQGTAVQNGNHQDELITKRFSMARTPPPHKKHRVPNRSGVPGIPSQQDAQHKKLPSPPAERLPATTPSPPVNPPPPRGGASAPRAKNFRRFKVAQ